MILTDYLLLSAVLFMIGFVIVLTRKNLIFILIGLELMLNAANINLIGFNAFHPERIDGQMFSIFVIVIAASESALGLAIIYQFVKTFSTSDIVGANKLRE